MSVITDGNAKFLTREQRLAQCRVDCPDGITWRVWQPGGEYERKFIIKNTHDKLQVISYKLPRQKATFFVDFPEPASISSGMAYTLVVRFRPTELVEIHDDMEIEVKGRGSFKVRLDAYTPYAQLTYPPKHDFEICPVHTPTRTTFPIKNTGTVPLFFTWDISEPFTIEPRVASLVEGASMDVTVTFFPTVATAVIAQAVCRTNDTNEVVANIKLTGVGKYAFLRIQEGSVIDFQEQLTSTTITRHVTLSNPSLVDCAFSLQRQDKDVTNAFTVSPMEGTVPKCGELRMTIKFSPKSTGAHYTADYIADTPAASTILQFRFTGAAKGPLASLSAAAVDFGDVSVEDIYEEPATGAMAVTSSNVVAGAGKAETGKSVVIDKYVSLRNHSELPLAFQFLGCDPGCAFQLEPAVGSISPKTSMNIRISFTPTTPINYLRRLFLLYSNAEQALVLDVFGTGYTKKSRPAPFDVKAVSLHFAKMEYGLGTTAPEEIEKLAEGLENDTPVSSDAEHGAREALRAAIEDASGKKRKRAVLASVFPSPASIASRPFVLENPCVTVRHEAGTEEYQVVIRNTTGTKATAGWSIPKDSLWHIHPDTCDVPAFGTASFRVRVSADAPPMSFGCHLECFVYFKSMRSFRLVSPHSFTPPTCLTLQCLHLAPFRENGPLPSISMPTALSFAPCRERHAVYQVIELTNTGDTAVAYDMKLDAQMIPDANNAQYFVVEAEPSDPLTNDTDIEDPMADERARLCKDVFMCYPSSGVIPPKSTSMALMRFSPSLKSRFLGAAHLAFNGSITAEQTIILKGEGFVPSVSLESESKLVFRPTTIGGIATREYTLENLSRIPLGFEALIPEEYHDVVQLTPMAGVLKGSERLKIIATFTPQQAKHYNFSFPFSIFAQDEVFADEAGNFSGSGSGSLQGKQTNSLTQGNVIRRQCTVMGEGQRAVLSIDPLSIDVGDIGVGTIAQKSITLFNTCVSDAAFVLRYIIRRRNPVPRGADLSPYSVTAAADKDTTNYNNSTAVVAAPNPNATEDTTTSELLPEVSFGPSAEGTVRARAHHNVLVNVKIRSRGHYDIIVFMLAGGDLSAVQRLPNPSDSELTQLPQCCLHVSGEHSVVNIADVRCVYQPKSQLWHQMSISRINSELARPVNAKDKALCMLAFDESLAQFEPIHCELGVDVFHAAPIRIFVALHNTGGAPVDFRFRFPLDNEVPREPWHADARGLDDPIAKNIDRGLFEISPRSGTIEAYDQAIVEFTYNHCEVGLHQLPVILRIQDGQQVLLRLQGITNAPETKFLAFHHSMRHELLPVAIGELEPPLQYTELQNLSATSVNYVVRENALLAMRDSNYDFPVLQCLNPKGVIPPMSTLLLSWFFRPLEVKQYEATVEIAVEGGEVYKLTLVGSGYHPKQITKQQLREYHDKQPLTIPAAPTLSHPSLPVSLSEDVIHFGSIPFHSLHRRHVSLNNSHPSDTFLCEWITVLQHGDQIIEVEPPHCTIAPGETVHFHITMFAGSTSHIIGSAIHCQVLNESLRQRRAAIMEQREKEAALQMPGSDLGATNQSLGRSSGRFRNIMPEHIMKPRHRHPVTTVPPKYQSINRLRKTIQRMEEMIIAEDVDENSEEWAHVEVAPTVVELLIQARVMPLDAFINVYGEEATKGLFFPTLLGSRLPAEPVRLSSDIITTTERDVVFGCLREVLKRIVQQNVVRDALLDPREDPVPYFCEMVGDTNDNNEAGKERPAAADTNYPPCGEVQCLAEEVLEGALYNIIAGALQGGGVIQLAHEQTKRQHRASTVRRASLITLENNAPSN